MCKGGRETKNYGVLHIENYGVLHIERHKVMSWALLSNSTHDGVVALAKNPGLALAHHLRPKVTGGDGGVLAVCPHTTRITDWNVNLQLVLLVHAPHKTELLLCVVK